MSVTYVSLELRRAVYRRANHQCEYCLIDEQDTFLGCQIDHVIAEKHGGETIFENLAVACTLCNRAKGSDIATLVDGALTRLYNPRVELWTDHFGIAKDQITILSKTSVGQATISLLEINTNDRLLERQTLNELGLYPPFDAQREMMS
jgi:hypothetical protein